jgi:hypothetical protein
MGSFISIGLAAIFPSKRSMSITFMIVIDHFTPGHKSTSRAALLCHRPNGLIFAISVILAAAGATANQDSSCPEICPGYVGIDLGRRSIAEFPEALRKLSPNGIGGDRI